MSLNLQTAAFRQIKSVLAVSALLLIFAAGFFVGHQFAARKLAIAEADAATWQASAQSNQTALIDVRQRLKQQRADLNAVKTAAQIELAGREAAEAQNRTLRQQRQFAIEHAAHESPACADLLRPLCPAVADRLFGSAAGGHAPNGG